MPAATVSKPMNSDASSRCTENHGAEGAEQKQRKNTRVLFMLVVLPARCADCGPETHHHWHRR